LKHGLICDELIIDPKKDWLVLCWDVFDQILGDDCLSHVKELYVNHSLGFCKLNERFDDQITNSFSDWSHFLEAWLYVFENSREVGLFYFSNTAHPHADSIE